MTYLSSTRPRDLESRETYACEVGSVEFLLRFAELLKARPGPKSIVQGIAEQTHTNFFPTPAAVISEEDGRFYLAGFASQDERVERIAIEEDLAKPYGSLTQAIRKTLNADRPEQHEIHLSNGRFQNVYAVPVRTSQSSALLTVFLGAEQRIGEAERTFLAVLAQVGAMALAEKELSQLFMRVTRSSRQWAEMFDSISDFMLLHDDHQQILRVNRSLSEKLGKHPAAVLGLPVRDLFGLSANAPACPFCLNLRGHEFREEFREPKTGSTYLVSSSRLRGGGEESQQIVHVLKDVTASRRAERLYRELFDNIQEGAYFSAPDGRLLEVNDALVRMLGYNSREELLNISAQDL